MAASRTGTLEAREHSIEGRDSVGLYLDEIARTPLLDAATEVELSKTIEAGLFAQHLLDTGHFALESHAPGPDLRADLRRYVRAFADGLVHNWGRAAATMAVSAIDDPAQRGAIATFRDGYVADVATILARARERGEPVDDGLGPEDVADDLTAPLFYRYLISHQPLDEGFVDAVTERIHALVTSRCRAWPR